MKLKFNDTEYCIIGGFSTNKSSREVKFSDIEIDFSNKTILVLPVKFPEVQVINELEEVTFYGYIDSFRLPRFDKENIVTKLSLTLMSPLAMLSRRTKTLIGTYNISDLFNLLYSDLISDGFTIAETNFTDGTITVKFIAETLESASNYLSNKLGLFIYVDELKRIKINSIDYLFGKDEVLNLNTSNYKDTDNIWYIDPSVASVDYANVLNAKNVRVYFQSKSINDGILVESYYPLFAVPRVLKTGDSIKLNYPIDISEGGIRKLIGTSDYPFYTYGLNIIGLKGASNFSSLIGIDTFEESPTCDDYIVSSDISFDEDNAVTDFKLVRDSFFKNLVTEIKYNGTPNLTINWIESDTALRYLTLKLINSSEIEFNKNKISPSGVIEKSLNLNGQWFIETELLTYIRTLLIENSNQTDTIELAFKGNKLISYDIGDRIKVDIPELFTVGEFIVTDSTYSKNNIETESIVLKLKTANVLENFIDFFRRERTEESENQTDTIFISELATEKLIESHEVL
jgi:hypothetical protein